MNFEKSVDISTVTVVLVGTTIPVAVKPYLKIGAPP